LPVRFRKNIAAPDVRIDPDQLMPTQTRAISEAGAGEVARAEGRCGQPRAALRYRSLH
jgi:hypothetical protein